MGKISFIYFDLAGVVFEYAQGLDELASRNGQTKAAFDAIFGQHELALARGDITLQDLWKEYKRQLHLAEPEDFYFEDFWIERFKPIRETHMLINELSQLYNIGIISNMYRGVFDKVKRRGLIPSVNYKAVIQSCEVGFAKPEAQMYNLAQMLSETAPENILYIDDRKEFVDTAKGLGWNSLQFNTTAPKESIHEIFMSLN